mmetsp:Transcript_4154/g.6465  ORF Transcript_4154/g.6465 Transcript_4154/m.6465 type:complete len:178 (-) Transcript_4154:1238-1771(-)
MGQKNSRTQTNAAWQRSWYGKSFPKLETSSLPADAIHCKIKNQNQPARLLPYLTINQLAKMYCSEQGMDNTFITSLNTASVRSALKMNRSQIVRLCLLCIKQINRDIRYENALMGDTLLASQSVFRKIMFLAGFVDPDEPFLPQVFFCAFRQHVTADVNRIDRCSVPQAKQIEKAFS